MTLFEKTVLIFLFLAVLLTGMMNFLGQRICARQPGRNNSWPWDLSFTTFFPLLSLLFVALINWGLKPLSIPLPGVAPTYWQLRINDLIATSAAIIIAWAAYRWIAIIERKLRVFARHRPTPWDGFFYHFICTCFRGGIPPVLVGYLVLRLEVPENIQPLLLKLPPIVLIFASGWILYRAAALIEEIVIQLGAKVEDSLDSRRVITRVRLIRQLVGVLIFVLMVGALLMMFKEVRSIGTSLLASAGVATVVLGLAAQKTFGTIFAGIQIALTQPIRIGDQIMVQKEFGTVEEITLTYVVIKLWDLRRLVLPINYFIDQPFENWTRSTTDVIGTVTIRVDFSAPVHQLREQFQQIVRQSKHWNRHTCSLHVSDCDAFSLELRMIASAPTPSESWELRCEIREKMIDYLCRHFPDCLPKGRADQKTLESWNQSVNLPSKS